MSQQTGGLGSKYKWQALTLPSPPLTEVGKIFDSTETCKTPCLSDVSLSTPPDESLAFDTSTLKFCRDKSLQSHSAMFSS